MFTLRIHELLEVWTDISFSLGVFLPYYETVRNCCCLAYPLAYIQYIQFGVTAFVPYYY